jgi:hypothetical protein
MLKWTLLDHGCHMSSVFLIHSHGCPLIYLFSRDTLPLQIQKYILPLYILKITKNMCNMKWQPLKPERFILSLLNHGKPLHNACSIHIPYAWWAVAKCDMSFEFALNVTHLSASNLTCITTTARKYILKLHIKLWWHSWTPYQGWQNPGNGVT